jgi:tetratricopeptide (TPR) repeat protein/KaiC/GvpD/RAD55 family RecA-like ATPase
LSFLERDRVPSPRPIAAKEVPLVDRTEEMNVLKEAVYRAVHGEGGLVFIHGEAGIGKTRLVRELGAYARSRGVQVLYGRCPALFRMDGVPPYVLWKEVIKDYLETCTPEQLYRVIGFYPAEVAKLVPEVSQKLRSIPQSFPISPEQEQNRLFEAVSQFITNISKETPLLVVLDDLQWTDPSSLLLLHYLARGVQKTSLLLLGAFRSTEIDDKHPLTPVLAELNRERVPQEIQLKRMSLSDVSEMIKNILEQDDVPEDFCKLVYEKTRGNPFFVEEVVKSLKEEKTVYLEEGKWKFKEISAIEFPKSVKNVVKARISRLDEESQNVLTMASFIGNDFTFEAICSFTGIEKNTLLKLMDKLFKTGLIKERVVRGEGICSFADVIVRDVVYEEVSPLARKELHGDVGRALEKVYAKTIDEHFGELAHHFLESGDRDKALDYFMKAGEKSQKMYAYDQALSYLDHALKLLEEKDGSVEEKVRVTERLGDIKTWTGQFDAGAKYWDSAIAMWTQLGDKKSVARLHVKIAHESWNVAGDKKRASEHHQMALEILEEESENTELAYLYEDIGHRLWRSGETEALSWLKKSLDLAEKLGDSRVLAECYNDLGALSWASGEFEKILGYWEQGLKIALESNSLEAALRLYCNLNSLYWWTGEPQKAFETVQKGLELARKVGDLNLLVWLDGCLSYTYWAMGEVQKALSINEDDLALVKRTRNVSYMPNALMSIGQCYLWLGEWDKSLQYLTEAVDMAKKTEEYGPSFDANQWLGELFMEMEDYEEAKKYFNESYSVGEKARDTGSQLAVAFPALSKLHLKKGETEKAKELVEKTCEFASTSKSRFLIANVEMLEGMLFREQKNWEQSIQHFEKSLQVYRELDAQKWLVPYFTDLLSEYGSMYLDRNKEGDKEMASSLLNQALDIYQKTGAIKRAEKTRSKMNIEGSAYQVVKHEPASIRLSTGHQGLDRLLGGGIPEAYSIALTAPTCDERDMLVKSFLETGAKKGEVTFFVTIDPSVAKPFAQEFQSNFYLFVCNPEANAIIKSSPNVFTLKGVENLTDISIALTSAIRRLDSSLKNPRRICIGLVSDVLLQHHAVETRRWLSALMTKLKSEGFTTLAVIDPRIHPSEELYAILGLFDGEMNVYEKETEEGSGKYLKIKKMSNQEYLEKELLLKKEELQKRK